MLRLPKKAASAKKKLYLIPGTYTSTVTSAEPAQGYAEGHARKVTYELTDSSGNRYHFKEIFRTGEPIGQRSEEFFDYLDKNGITEWEDFVGCQEVLTLHYEFIRGRRYLNIDQNTRQFIYEDEEDESNAVAE